MGRKTIQEIVEELPPEKALKEMAGAAKRLLSAVDEQAGLDFVMNLIGDASTDKVSSLVHLWLAKCMGEGVDPTEMCQSLVEKVQSSKQLRAVSDPEILVLFEDWLEELEEEVISLVNGKDPIMEPFQLARRLGMSQAGARFLLAKLKREGRV